MALAISFISESSDHYLLAFDGTPSIEDILKDVHEITDLAYLEINQIVYTGPQKYLETVRAEVQAAISTAEPEE